VEHSVGLVQLKLWGLFLMGQFVVRGREPGVWLFSPSGMYIDLFIRLEFA
jgi:hypothetical protein